ncbi:hypothetical protein ABIA38_004505 [Embleya sp. AB8]
MHPEPHEFAELIASGPAAAGRLPGADPIGG